MNDTTHPAVDGRAWADYCESLKSAGEFILEHSTDDLDRVEGFRYLSRLARGGLQAFVENGSPPFSQILSIPHNLKIGCDNPDALYQNVAVDPAFTYRIHGRRGSVNYLSIGAYAGGYGAGAAPPGRDGVVEDTFPDPEGVVDLLVSVSEPESLAPGQRWLRMSPATTTIIIRNFYLDRATERPSELTLECLDPPMAYPEALTPEQLERGSGHGGPLRARRRSDVHQLDRRPVHTRAPTPSTCSPRMTVPTNGVIRTRCSATGTGVSKRARRS